MIQVQPTMIRSLNRFWLICLKYSVPTRQAFADYFWRVYDQLAAQQDDLPTYFHFLTVMAFYVFVEERVDAAVIETGIGGLHDCTNVIRYLF